MAVLDSVLNLFSFSKSAYTTLTPGSSQIHPLASKFNVASEDIKAKIVETSQNSKENAHRIIKEAKAGVSFENGESRMLPETEVDGWYIEESSASQESFVVVKLGQKSLISGFGIDTSYLVNGFNSTVTILAATREGPTAESASFQNDWVELVAGHQLQSDDKQFLKLNRFTDTPFTHLKLIIAPHGAIARFKVFGDFVVPPYETLNHDNLDLASVFSGSIVVDCSNGKFSSPNNLLLAGRGQVMGDGWETARSRVPGNVEFATIKLGHPGRIETLEIDTNQYKGNFPPKVRVLGTNSKNNSPNLDTDQWDEVLHLSSCVAHKNHVFKSDITDRVYTHLRLQLYPDGGVKRFRAFGVAEKPQVSQEPTSHKSTGAVRHPKTVRGTPYPKLSTTKVPAGH
ncbi:Allantoicase-domain-containing protein [Conidiobolus coronatus NRRL 28638]|uniref:Allantoicase-domain-containing protein n=1 Tax=Conidiobolus coronatus (strain ATCC 28846 / CBS 209.66 / NRRL 28638) TaxID=796925 RepID=A0A137PE51_CONC2|nr:Allantoicase-domain-containing protein [Conidiobolus coronatus NRRL 28638]|eukprot:KXN73284.1 Allantoicase-domain-containing protein [Conidiobolus coronatus NRRL 28638]